MNNEWPRQAIVPTAGWGTRLLPLTYAVPKELLPVGRKPALQWIAEELAQTGIEHLVLVANPNKISVEQLFRDQSELTQRLRDEGKLAALASLWPFGPHRDVRISVAYQRQQLGLGHAVACGRADLAAGPFIVALGDSLLGPAGSADLLRRLTEAFISHQAAAAIALERVPLEQVSRFGVAAPGRAVSGAMELQGIVEKPSPGDAPSNLVAAGRYLFSYEIFEAIDQTPRGAGGEFQLTDAIQWLIDQGRRIIGVELAENERRYDIGNVSSYYRALLEFDPDFAAPAGGDEVV